MSMTWAEIDRLQLQCALLETLPLSPFVFPWLPESLGVICRNRGGNSTKVLAMKLLSSVRPSETVARLTYTTVARTSVNPCLVLDGCSVGSCRHRDQGLLRSPDLAN